MRFLLVPTMAITLGLALGAESATARGPDSAGLVERTSRLAAARTRLDRALGVSETTPTRERLAEIHRAMDEIREGLSLYFHGRLPGDEAGRAAWAGLRSEVMRLLAGGRPVVVVAHDVLRFHPSVHRHVARVCEQVGEFRRAIEHLRIVQAVEGPTAGDLRAIVAAYRAAGDPDGAAVALAELEALNASATTTGVP